MKVWSFILCVGDGGRRLYSAATPDGASAGADLNKKMESCLSVLTFSVLVEGSGEGDQNWRAQ